MPALMFMLSGNTEVIKSDHHVEVEATCKVLNIIRMVNRQLIQVSLGMCSRLALKLKQSDSVVVRMEDFSEFCPPQIVFERFFY